MLLYFTSLIQHYLFIYLFIFIYFQSGNYLVQGMKLAQTPGGTLNGVNLPNHGTDVNLSSTENIVKTIQVRLS